MKPPIDVFVLGAGGLDLPPDAEWLTVAERHEAERWRNPARRQAWRSARWVAKHAMAERTAFAGSLLSIEILSRCEQRGLGRAPRACVADQRWLGGLSITHVEGWVAVAVGDGRERRLGVDLALFQRLPASFFATWFDTWEQSAIAQGDPHEAVRYWAAKEALFKALGEGESFRAQNYPLQRDGHGKLCLRGERPFEAKRPPEAMLVHESLLDHCVLAVATPAQARVRVRMLARLPDSPDVSLATSSAVECTS